MTWDRRLYCPFEGRRAEGFFTLKNPTASVRFEPVNLGTKSQHATSRPPKPLSGILNEDTGFLVFGSVHWQSRKIMSWVLRIEAESSSMPLLFTVQHRVISQTHIMSTTVWTRILVEHWLTGIPLNCQNLIVLQSHLQKFSECMNEWMNKWCRNVMILWYWFVTTCSLHHAQNVLM